MSEILTEKPEDEGDDQEASAGAEHEPVDPESIEDAPEHEVEDDESESN